MENQSKPCTAIYVRISQDRTSERAGVGRQLADTTDLCERNKWAIADVFEDNDVSAADRRKDRPAYRRLIEEVESGRITRIVTWHMDRLYRQIRQLEDLIDLAEKGVLAVETVEGSGYDLNSIEGRKRARQAVTDAIYESDKLGWRVARAKDELAREGKPAGGGNRPFGYEPDGMTVNEPEADALRWVAESLLAGKSMNSIVNELHADGVRGTRGSPFSVSSLRTLLLRPRIAGLRQHRGEIIGEAAWPAILPRESWERLCAVLKDPSRRLKGPRRRYLLSGLARCGVCAGRLSVSRLPDRPGFTYACRSVPGRRCGKVRVNGAPLEELVVASAFTAVDTDRLAPAPDDSAVEFAQQLEDVERRLDALARIYADGELSQREWLIARDRLSEREASLRKELETSASTFPPELLTGASALRSAWEGWNIEHRRTFLDQVFEAVVVNPARPTGGKFEPERVSLVWRA